MSEQGLCWYCEQDFDSTEDDDGVCCEDNCRKQYALETSGTNQLDKEQCDEVNAWLTRCGYESIADWGEDSDYRIDVSGWFDEHGNAVDLSVQAFHAMEAERSSVREAETWDCQGCGATYAGDWPWGGYCREQSCRDAYRAEFDEDHNDTTCEYVKVLP